MFHPIRKVGRGCGMSFALATLGWAALSGCQSDCEKTKSCPPNDQSTGGLSGDGGDGDGDRTPMGGGGLGGAELGDGDSGGRAGEGDGGSGGGPGDGDGDSGGGPGDGDGDSGGSLGDGDGDDPMVVSCDGDEVLCDGACVDPLSDPSFCGARNTCEGDDAGEECEGGWACQQGTCTLICEEALLACDGACIDPMTDEAHCGAANDCSGRPNAGRACGEGAVCVKGGCAAWSAPAQVPATGEPNWLGLFSDAQGNATLLQTVNGLEATSHLYGAERAAGGIWTAMDEPILATTWPIRGQLAAKNSLGHAVAVVADVRLTRGGDFSTLYVLDFPADGTISAPDAVTPQSDGQVVSAADVAEDGTLLVGWALDEYDIFSLGARVRTSEAMWLEPQTFIDPADEVVVGDVEVAAHQGSEMLMMWERGAAEQREVQWMAYSPTEGFSSFQSLSSQGLEPANPTLMTNRTGGMYVAWHEEAATVDLPQRLARYNSTAGAWADIAAAHPSLNPSTSFHGHVLHNGDLLTFCSGVRSLDLQQYSSDASSWVQWDSPVPDAAGDVWGVQSGRDDEGNLFIAYLHNTGTLSPAGLWVARWEAASDTWGEPVRLESGAARNHQLHVMPDGRAMVGWTLEGQERAYVAHFE